MIFHDCLAFELKQLKCTNRLSSKRAVIRFLLRGESNFFLGGGGATKQITHLFGGAKQIAIFFLGGGVEGAGTKSEIEHCHSYENLI